MAIHLRQICLVAERLDPVRIDLKTLLGLQPCFVDKAVRQFGLENMLFAAGTNFIEVVAPIAEDTAAGRYLNRRKGDGGYMVICQAETEAEQQLCRNRADANGVRIAWEYAEDGYRIMQLHPGDMRASFLELDWHERSEMTGTWPPAGGNGWEELASSDCTIIGAELQAADPSALADHWASIIGEPVRRGESGPEIALANARLRFVEDKDGRGAGLSGVDLAVSDPAMVIAAARSEQRAIDENSLNIAGVRFVLHPACTRDN